MCRFGALAVASAFSRAGFRLNVQALSESRGLASLKSGSALVTIGMLPKKTPRKQPTAFTRICCEAKGALFAGL